MNQLVELERVDLAGVQPCESLPDVFEQQSELLLVVSPDQLARGAARRSARSPAKELSQLPARAQFRE